MNDLDKSLSMIDIAIYQEKSKQQVIYIDKNKIDQYMAQISFNKTLKKALHHRELIAFFQPIVDSNTNSIVAVETLSRWFIGDENIPILKYLTAARVLKLSVKLIKYH